MLVEINLLPQKEAKNKTLFLLVIVAAIVLFIGATVGYFLNKSYENELSSLQSQITNTEELIAAEQVKNVQQESASSSITELQQAVRWAEDYPIKTVPIIKKLSALLPERGFLQNINHDEAGTVTLVVQFEQSREAAYYLNHLLNSEWLTGAKLLSIDTVTSFYEKESSDDTIDESKLKNDKFVPRYIGQFELTLNRDVIKVEASSSEENGGEEK